MKFEKVNRTVSEEFKFIAEKLINISNDIDANCLTSASYILGALFNMCFHLALKHEEEENKPVKQSHCG
jgi:hypothetical protein